MDSQQDPNPQVRTPPHPDLHSVRIWGQDDLSWLAQLGHITDWLGDQPLARALLDITPTPTAILDAQSRIVACSPSLAAEAGVDPAQVQGRRLGDLLQCVHSTPPAEGCGKGPLCQHCDLNQALQMGCLGLPADIRHHHLSDQPDTLKAKEFDARVKPLPEAGHGFSVCALEDVSEVLRRRMLERVFFHDLLNRVAALDTLAQSAFDPQSSPGEQRESLDMTRTLVLSLREEIHAQQLLMLAEDGSLVPRFAQFDASALLRTEVEVARHLDCAWNKQIWLDSAQPIPLESDPVLLSRVLLNLLKNALEATAAGGAVHCSVFTRSNGVVFAVENAGAIPPHVLRNLFHRRYSTKGAERGLGLYGVKLLAEKYLGGAAALLADGKTVRFEISLPA